VDARAQGGERARGHRLGAARRIHAREIRSIDQIRGRMSQVNVKNPTLFERANYVRMLQDYDADR